MKFNVIVSCFVPESVLYKIVDSLQREFGSARLLAMRGDAHEIEVESKPTLPELIAKWHADPTAENRKELRAALAEHKTAYIDGDTVYFAGNRHGVAVLEVY